MKANKLTLEHLAPYLPYGLKIEPLYQSMGHMGGFHKTELSIDVLYKNELEDIKPIVRPLSDLTKEIEVNGEKFVPIEKYTNDIKDDLLACIRDDTYFEMLPYFVVKKLLEWHFDVFGLIEKDLAIDINTL